MAELLQPGTIKAAGDAVRVGTITIYDRMNEREFRSEMERKEAKREPERIDRTQQRPNRCKYERRTRTKPGKPLFYWNLCRLYPQRGTRQPGYFPFIGFGNAGEDIPPSFLLSFAQEVQKPIDNHPQNSYN